MAAHVPRRRCVGCGRIAPKSELLRVAAVADERDGLVRAVLDTHARMPGRGAYLCRGEDAASPRPECLAQAVKRRGIARALRRPIAGDLVSDDVKLVESMSR